MRMSRRMGLNSIVRFKIPTFSGTYVLSGDEKKGQMVIKTSGTLTFLTNAKIDVFVVGGGTGGNYHGGGGGSGFTATGLSLDVPKGAYAVTVGAGGGKGDGNASMTNGLPGGQSKVVIGSTNVSAGSGKGGGYTSASDTTPNYLSGSYGGSGGGGTGGRFSDD